jgi:hypothetical protein
MESRFEGRANALRLYLDSIGHHYEIEQFTPGYREGEVLVNHRPFKYGDGPAEVQATADHLRESLIRLFGPDAECWTSDFLRIQEMEYQKLKHQVHESRQRWEDTARGLPPVLCEPVHSSLGVQKHFPLRREMLEGKREFAAEEKRGERVVKIRYYAVSPFTADQKLRFTQQLYTLEEHARAYDEALTKLKGLKAYGNLEPVIKASFDWNRLGNKHDNETAHAYQEIVNALYFVGKADDTHAKDYRDQLRRAFDGKELEDYRREETKADAEYLVLTGEEAHELARESILDTAWAFIPKFLQKHLVAPLSEQAISKFQEGCEDANEAILALIKDKEAFVQAAISADGLGHFLSGYDHKTHEFETQRNGAFHERWFIFCQNRDWEEKE